MNLRPDMAEPDEKLVIGWRNEFTSTEANRLHAAAFNSKEYSDDEWDWRALAERHSLGWCTARHDNNLVGFVNVITDGLVHAWLQDVMVQPAMQRQGVGASLVELAVEQATAAGCEWLHVDFDDDATDFYYRRCGFKPTNGGLRYLQ